MSKRSMLMLGVGLVYACGAFAGTILFSGSQSDTEAAINTNDSYGQFSYETCGWLMSGNGNYTQLNLSWNGGFFPALGQASSVSSAVLTYQPDQPSATTADMVRFRLAIMEMDWSCFAKFDIGYHGTGTFVDIFSSPGCADSYLELGNFIPDFFPNKFKMDFTETTITFSGSDDWGVTWQLIYTINLADATSEHWDLTGKQAAILINAVHASDPWKLDEFEWTGTGITDKNMLVEGCNSYEAPWSGPGVPVTGVLGLAALGIACIGAAARRVRHGK